ncbi:MAG: hypothetical protein HRT36_01105 [Alphaproteobacteria bacterium]|nr:hypothetical protein [Alphaproteobacteria bacterium]
MAMKLKLQMRTHLFRTNHHDNDIWRMRSFTDFLLRDWGFSDRCGKFAACAFFAVSRLSQGRLQNAGMLALGIVLAFNRQFLNSL